MILSPIRHYLVRLLIASNQLSNAILGGDPQMSMSARAGLARDHGSKAAAVECKVLDIFDIHHPNPLYPPDADHCTIAVIDYITRKAEVKQ